MTVRVGIDFGTSTTVAAVGRGADVDVVADSGGRAVFPSCVAFLPEGPNGSNPPVQVGTRARVRVLMDPANTLYSFKRIVGLPWSSSEVAEFRSEYPFELEKDSQGWPRFVTRAGKLTAEEVATHVFDHVNTFVPAQRTTVTVAVPTTWSAEQDAATRRAAEQAGFKNVELIREAIAAALAYGSQISDGIVVVYDLGGGTFDLSVLRFSAGQGVEVLAHGGEPYLGGDDVDLAIARWAAEEILKTHQWDVRTSAESYAKLRYHCEQVKIRLSLGATDRIPLAYVDPVLGDATLAVDRARVDSLCSELVRRTFALCDEVLRRAGIQTRDVSNVVLAGGGSHMPVIRTGVAKYFGRPPLATLPPDRVIALGAATEASKSLRLSRAVGRS